MCVTLGNFCTCIPYPKIDERKKRKQDRANETATMRDRSVIPTINLTKSELVEILMFHFGKQGRRYPYSKSEKTLDELRSDIIKNKIDTQLYRVEMRAASIKADEDRLKKAEEERIYDEFLQKKVKSLWKNRLIWTNVYVKFFFGRDHDFTEEKRQERVAYFSSENLFKSVVSVLYNKDSKIPRHTIVHHGDGKATIHFIKGFNKHL